MYAEDRNEIVLKQMLCTLFVEVSYKKYIKLQGDLLLENKQHIATFVK